MLKAKIILFFLIAGFPDNPEAYIGIVCRGLAALGAVFGAAGHAWGVPAAALDGIYTLAGAWAFGSQADG